jgi:hypothetical protein
LTVGRRLEAIQSSCRRRIGMGMAVTGR